MPRVLGIDPGTVSLDICGLDDGRVFLDGSVPTADALADPRVLPQLIAAHVPLDLVAGPSGYGLPLVFGHALTEADVRLACLAPPGESGGIGGLGAVMRALARLDTPVVFTPGVVHLASVPAHRKINRIDMGTADKVCATALAVHDLATRDSRPPSDVSCIVLELGGAFSAAVAVERGRIVDGLGGTSGPLGMAGAGALDGEVAFLAGHVSKQMLFHGGARDAAAAFAMPDAWETDTHVDNLPWNALFEGAVKAVLSLRVSAPSAQTIVVSGRLSRLPHVLDSLRAQLDRVWPDARIVHPTGFATAKHAAQGAALIADGLSGGASSHLVDALGIRSASGTVLDHLVFISPAQARARIGL